MGALKAIDIDLQAMDNDIDFTNRDDIFDIVVDACLANYKLSMPTLKAVAAFVFDTRLDDFALYNCEEFADAFMWHFEEN